MHVLGHRQRPDGIKGRVRDGLRRQTKAACDDSGHIQQIVNDARQSRGVALDGRQGVLRAIGRQLVRLQHPCPSHDGIQGRAELVRHRAEKLILEMVGPLGIF